MPSAELIVSVVGWNQLHSVSRLDTTLALKTPTTTSSFGHGFILTRRIHIKMARSYGLKPCPRATARVQGRSMREKGRRLYGWYFIFFVEVLARTFTRRQEKEEKRTLRRRDKEIEESIDGDNEERLGVCENPFYLQWSKVEKKEKLEKGENGGFSNLVAQPTHKFLEYMVSGLRAITNRLPSPARAHIAEPFPIPLTRAIVYKSRPPIR
ncbi:hypothetical protein HZH68_001140 [Vespula germanica]|uniref:Uncharacterized protein n=1 Tax=Vespula germanica TaxID=30212 RepID=A0A834U6N9_VESGE|nr:hypothetical protein HZH68_001140 [Vespula germanica]